MYDFYDTPLLIVVVRGSRYSSPAAALYVGRRRSAAWDERAPSDAASVSNVSDSTRT